MTSQRFPRSIPVAIATTYAVGGGLFALHLVTGPAVAIPRLATLVPYFVLIVAGAYLVLHYRYRGQIEAIDLIESSLAPAIVALSAPIVMILAAAGVAAANAIRRNTPMKAAFNAGQTFAASGVATLIYRSLRDGDALTARNAMALTVSLFVMAACTHMAITFIIVLSRREPLSRVLAGFAPVILPGWVAGSVVNSSFGLLFASAHQWSSAMLVVALIPLIALHVAFRAYAAATSDQARLRGLQLATQALARPVDPVEAFPEFVDRVRECFDCEAVDLVILEGARRRVFRAEAGRPARTWTEPAELTTLASALELRGQTVRVNARTATPALQALLAKEGRRDCLAAPLVDRDSVLGILVTYDGNGLDAFRRGEATVLEALAREGAAATQKSALLGTVFEERRKLSEIVDHTSDGILTLAADGEILLWSPGLERISGYPATDMVGTRNLGALRPRDAEGIDLMIEQWSSGGELTPEVQIITRDGEPRWLSCSYSPVTAPDGTSSNMIIVVRDATAQHEVERLKDDFVATVSHELRTPLTPMKAWANTLLHLGDRLDPEQRKEGLTTVLRQVERLERLITNLLEVSKIERGVGDVRESVVDARGAVAKVVEEARAANQSREILFSASRSRMRALGDELWIEQIVSNLISNALKYAPAAEPIEIRMREAPGTILISVIDHGPGIPASQAEKIFNRFHRLGDHLTRAQGGAGLGLYIARRLTQSIGAVLRVESSPGSGATFVLELRAANQLAIVLDEENEPAALMRARPDSKQA